MAYKIRASEIVDFARANIGKTFRTLARKSKFTIRPGRTGTGIRFELPTGAYWPIRMEVMQAYQDQPSSASGTGGVGLADRPAAVQDSRWRLCVIETKFRSGSGLIEFRNGQGIFVDGREEDGDPLNRHERL